MQRKTRFSSIVAITLLFTMFIGIVVNSQASELPTNPGALTATQIIVGATETPMVIGTLIPAPQITATWETFYVTRTAIAITRYPELALSPTPNAYELTATKLLDNVAGIVAANLTPSPGMLSGSEMTATSIIQTATQRAALQTAYPLIVFPTNTSAPCESALAMLNHSELSEQLERELTAAGVNSSSIDILSVVFQTGNEGCDQTIPLNAGISITFILDDLLDQATMIERAERTLAVLSRFPLLAEFEVRTSRLLIFFAAPDQFRQRWVETNYDIALQAYREGLRGDKLIEALGGISPLF